MSPEEKAEAAGAGAEAQERSLLDQAIEATNVERDELQRMMEALAGEATKDTFKVEKNVSLTLKNRIAAVDEMISRQLAAIMHKPEFQKLEGSWRGFHHLVHNSETGTHLKIRVLNITKDQLYKDLDKASEFDQSQTFQKLYEHEFGMPGGEPYGALIGDYEFTNHPQDVELLDHMSHVAGAAFCPFISAAAPGLFGYKSFTEMPKTRDMASIFDAAKYVQWRAFRDSEDSRFVSLVMPRVLSRLPYGESTNKVDAFRFEEVELGETGEAKEVPHDQYCWMNAAWVLGTRLTAAFAEHGWCTAIRGVENGGKVEKLPMHVFKTSDGDDKLMCPTEIGITDRREKELSDLGFLPLCHFKNQDYSVFFGGQTTQKPKDYGPRNTNATANAEISARLPYIMATSRIAHYLKVIGRDKIGSFMQRADCEDFLKRWISNYVLVDDKPTADLKRKYPLAQAEIQVEEVPGKPGSYQAVAWLRPWLQLEELTASLRMVATIPKKTK